ncbi:MAG: hypothetical protein RLZZ517_16 [Candidatus Parcubacteria bacterium]|jgi:glutathione synthase/RimK-type ligase-like ATP-grasp enzyme
MSQIKKRFFVEAIENAAREQGIETHWMSDSWICELKKGSQTSYIYGYNFPLNSATAWEVARDKTATSKVLIKNKIACVEHNVFIRPTFDSYKLKETHSDLVFEYAEKIGYPLVCKDNCGAAGKNVFKVNSKQELKDTLSLVWKNSRGAALCSFYDIECEYRFFVLDGEVQFVFKKVLKSSEEWKFNLNQGGEVVYETLEEIPWELYKMAVDAASALTLNLCSIDIIKLKGSASHLILEVNTSITTEHFSQISKAAKDVSLNLYKNILKKIFE